MPNRVSVIERKKPLVTFALFAYNQQSYIREAISSALLQDYEPLEIILSDDCSTDKTFEIIQEMANSYVGPHLLILNRNSENLGAKGIGLHVNKVFEMASGELVVFAAGDDISLPRRTSVLVDMWLASGKPEGSLHSAVETLSKQSKLSEKIIHGRLDFCKQSIIECIRIGAAGLVGCSHAITPGIYKRFGPLSAGTLFEDRTLAFRSFLAGSIIYSPQILVKYRIHDSNVSGVNMYSDEYSWNRWINGVIECLNMFYSDYVIFISGKELDSDIEKEIKNGIMRAELSRGITSQKLTDRLSSAYYYSYNGNISDRIAFILQRIGYDNSIMYRSLSFIWRLRRFI
jgi:glycosyltransferase involved in cell wall biosynthesis